ncbi:MAG: methylated-DNA--[protein]-cysteine S-methyltransferase [Archangium sp.]
MNFRYDLMKTPVGELAVVVDEENRLRHVGFLKDNAPYGRHVSLAEDWKRAKDPGGLCTKLKKYFDGQLKSIDDLPIELEGTTFELKVWNALRTIPCGETWSYAQLARAIGQPTATRAVGLANGRNPIAIVVPCHRVIGANGKLTGYGGGIHRKEWLLAHEGSLKQPHLPL